jgi:hypothetical protein
VKEESRSFLKKEPKNLYESGLAVAGEAAAKRIKSFLLLFFKKEALAFAYLSSPDCPGAGRSLP